MIESIVTGALNFREAIRFLSDRSGFGSIMPGQANASAIRAEAEVFEDSQWVNWGDGWSVGNIIDAMYQHEAG